MPWNPTQYLTFNAERLRPALDLLAQVPLETPATVVDLGCGPGHVTRILQERWPGARITGVDNSPEMLRQAAADGPGLAWQLADLAQWTPAEPVDVIYANASLHWLDGHGALLPRLMGCLRPGGCLAIQMPRNFHRPAHLCAFAVAEEGPWRERLLPLLRRSPVAEPEQYLDWLTPLASRVDLWHTDYLHLLQGPDPVLAWTRGSVLVPLLEALDEADRGPFVEAFAARVRTAFPVDAAGRTLFWFRRLFLVARAQG